MELKKILVKRADELPERIQKENSVFGSDLVEIRLFSSSPIVTMDSGSIIPIKGRFSSRLRQILEEDSLLK